MKRWVIFLFACLLANGQVLAQTTQDFAARYMKEHADDKELECVTIGPKMLGELLKLKSEEEDAQELKAVISNIKSIRIITSKSATDEHRLVALELLEKNSKRYAPYKKADSDADYTDCIWVRRRAKQIVELVYVEPDKDKNLMILNITGRIGDDFIDKLVKI